MEPRRPGKAELLMALLSTATMAALTWYSMASPAEREQARMRALAGLHRLAGRLARRAGHKGMGDELAGRDYQRYSVAFRLSQLRDRLARELEDMRP